MIPRGNFGGFTPWKWIIECITPIASLVKPADVHKLDVSLNTVCLLIIILLTKFHALSDDCLEDSVQFDSLLVK